MLDSFLSAENVKRAQRVIQRLSAHNLRSFVLTGGWAVEIHHVLRGSDLVQRSLTDIDFVAGSFECLPKSLQNDFLFRHVHPFDPPGKTILQAVDPEQGVRVDVFNDGGIALSRAQTINIFGWQILVISLQDLLARMTRLSLDIAHGGNVPAKHVRDFLRLQPWSDVNAMETVWMLHRRPNHPVTFREAREMLLRLIPTRQDLLIDPEYSRTYQPCARCIPTDTFQLADPQRLYSLLGYY
jgi:hypothetical protein